MNERMHIEPRIDPHGAIVIGAVHGTCFHPLGWIGDSQTIAMMVFSGIEALRNFIRELAAISVNLSQQEGLEVAEIMAEAEQLLGQTGQDGPKDDDGTLD